MKINRERLALLISAISAGLFAVMGLVVGVVGGSVMILFDSAYSLLSLALASISLWALYLAQQPATAEYPFGRITVEPIAVLIKGIVIFLVCVISVAFAAASLVQGGRVIDLDISLLFGVVNVFGCALTWWFIVYQQRYKTSPLMAAEVRQWQMDTWLSAAVLLGFILAYGLQFTPFTYLVPYADPVLVLIIGTYFAYIPVQMIRQALREILLGAPSEALRTQLQSHADGFPIRVAKVGGAIVLRLPVDMSECHAVKLKFFAEAERLAAEQQLRLLVVQSVDAEKLTTTQSSC